MRRIELTKHLNYSSKLNRNRAFIQELVDSDGPKEATPFLEALATLSAFERVWEKALVEWKEAPQDQDQETQEQKKILDDVMNLFTEQAKVSLCRLTVLLSPISPGKERKTFESGSRGVWSGTLTSNRRGIIV